MTGGEATSLDVTAETGAGASAEDARTRKRKATHARIYAAAMRLFEEEGFERVSVGRITQAAGVSVPTFYAHFTGKEQIVLPVPTGDDISAVVALQPAGLPVGERVRRASVQWFGLLGPDELRDALARWRVVATTPNLRTRAAEYERETAALILDAISPDGAPTTADAVVVNAYMSALTTVLLSWAAANGARSLEELIAEAFAALRGT